MNKLKIAITISLLLLMYQVGCISSEKKSSLTTSIPTSNLKAPISSSIVQISRRTPKATYSPTINPIRETVESQLATSWAPVYATFIARNIMCDDGYELELPDRVIFMSNETWSIFTCSPKADHYKDSITPGVVDFGKRYTKLVKTDFSQNWIISHKDFSWSGRPHALLYSLLWTQDGKYVYLIPAHYPSGDGFDARDYFWDGKALYRFNLSSGDLLSILPYANRVYAYSLSPNEEYLVYSTPEKKGIVHIQNMNNGIEQQVEIEGNYVLTGAFVWNYDSTQLFFASALEGWDEGKSGISIFRLSMKNMHLQAVLYNDNRLLVPYPNWESSKYWTDENMLNVMSLHYMSADYLSELTLNIETGKIIVLATPNPSYVYTATPQP